MYLNTVQCLQIENVNFLFDISFYSEEVVKQLRYFQNGSHINFRGVISSKNLIGLITLLTTLILDAATSEQ